MCVDLLNSLTPKGQHMIFYFHSASSEDNVGECLKRIRLRNRPGEELITREYLDLIEKANEQFYVLEKERCIDFDTFNKLII